MDDTTEWFPASINPVRAGWYEVQSNPPLHWNHRCKLTGRPFRYWCGKQWKNASPSEAWARGLGPSIFGSHPSHQWRGLTSGGGQMSIPLPPMPEPAKYYRLDRPMYTADQMHAHAAAVSAAAKDAEIAALRQYLDAAQRRGEELRAQVAALEGDAGRYKYLRDVAWHSGSLIFYAERYGPEDWDAHIDAALAARKGEA